MDDGQIVQLYFDRDERALSLTAKKYGAYCYAVAFGILNSEEDSKESVNGTYLEAWNRIPPHKPNILKIFLGRLTRCISIDKWRKKTAGKRGAEKYTRFSTSFRNAYRQAEIPQAKQKRSCWTKP